MMLSHLSCFYVFQCTPYATSYKIIRLSATPFYHRLTGISSRQTNVNFCNIFFYRTTNSPLRYLCSISLFIRYFFPALKHGSSPDLHISRTRYSVSPSTSSAASFIVSIVIFVSAIQISHALVVHCHISRHLMQSCFGIPSIN